MSNPLRIVADENIPHVEAAFGRFGAIETKPGRAIGRAEVRGADVLLVRSVTPVGASLLKGSGVTFVGSATIGTDHVDQPYLEDQGIAFAHAPGSNAHSVADYVVAALLDLARRHRRALAGRTVGVVGCGNIGDRLVRRLSALGLTVLPNDPPRAEAETDPPYDFYSLDTVLRRSDILTLHVPLTTTGPHPTHHLIGTDELARLREGAWLVNTSRGPVVNAEALRRATDRLGGLVLDVWEHEPRPDPALVRAADLATPHIAGYALDGKVRGTALLYRALCRHLGVEPTWTPSSVLRPTTPDELHGHPPDPRLPATDALHRLAQQAYDIRADDRRLRALLDRPPEEQGSYFSHLRKTYPRRREMQQYSVRRTAIPEPLRTPVAEGLTLQLT